MEFLMQKGYALCNLYDTLCKNHNPSDNTRELMQTLERKIEELAGDISLQEEPTKLESATTEDDDTPY